jgi:hypothetical protein
MSGVEMSAIVMLKMLAATVQNVVTWNWCIPMLDYWRNKILFASLFVSTCFNYYIT